MAKKIKRVMAVSCTHGASIDLEAAAKVLRVKREHKPHITIHLGDWMDTAAFMRSASERERGQSIIDDVEAGLSFLSEYKPDVLFCGNHDDRLWQDVHHPNKIRADCARLVIDRIEAYCALKKARLIPYTGALDSTGWLKIGPVVWGHGVMFGENAARDHAEAFASHAKHVVFGHTHRVLVQSGRTMGETMGHSIGCLCDKPAMAYAKNRRQTMAWQHAVMIGEITKEEACLQIVQLGTSNPAQMPEMKL